MEELEGDSYKRCQSQRWRKSKGKYKENKKENMNIFSLDNKIFFHYTC